MFVPYRTKLYEQEITHISNLPSPVTYTFFCLFQPSAFSLGDICLPQMANVLKVFLENGQTKSFKYDSTTTVQVCTFSFLAYTVRPLHDVLKFSKQDVVTSLRDKLCLSADEHFSLVLEHVKSLKRNKLTLLDPKETLARVHCSYFVKRFLKYRTINSTRLLQDPARTSFDVCFV